VVILVLLLLRGGIWGALTRLAALLSRGRRGAPQASFDQPPMKAETTPSNAETTPSGGHP
jgi:hypothetical protein